MKPPFRVALATMVVAAIGLGAPLLQGSVASAAPSVNLNPIASQVFNPSLGPQAVHTVFLPDGRLLVDDSTAGTITEMNADGTGQTLFASGLNEPGGMAVVDTSSVTPGTGFVYVACAGLSNPKTAGTVERFDLDGSNELTYASGNGYSFANPRDVAADPSGDVYVVDGTTLDEIHVNGDVSLVATGFNQLNAVAIDPSTGEIYVGDEGNSAIYYLDPGSSVYTYLASSTFPSSLAVSGSTLIVADANANLGYVSQIQTMGLEPTPGTPTTLLTLPEGFYTGISVGPSSLVSGAGDLFLGLENVIEDPTTMGQGEVLHTAPDGTGGFLVAQGGGPSFQRFSQMTYDPTTGKLFALDVALGTVVEMNTDGSEPKTIIWGADTADDDFPYYLAVDPTSGDIFVSDLHYGQPSVVREFPSTGGSWASGTVLSGSIPAHPTGITVDHGQLVVATSDTCELEIGAFDGTGFSTLASGVCATSLATGSDGNVYAVVPSPGSAQPAYVAKYSSDGHVVQTLPLPADAAPLEATVDASDRVFVTDTNHGLDEVSSDGVDPHVVDGTADYLGVTSDDAGDVFLGDSTEIDALGGLPAVPGITSLNTQTGTTSADTDVSITGTNLDGATSVEVVKDSNPASLVLTLPALSNVTATSADVTIPKTLGKGVYDLVVVTPGGASSTGAQSRFTVLGPPSITSLSPSSGSMAGGTSVTINGQNLSTATDVAFGATHLVPTVVSDTELTVTSPLSEKLGFTDLRVTTAAGESPVVVADRFLYTAPSAPVISSLSSTSGPAAGGQSLTITGTNLLGVSKVTVGTTVINAATFIAHSAPTSVTLAMPSEPAGSTTVKLTTPGGTSGTKSYTYVAAPMPTGLSRSVGSTTGGQSLTITGTKLANATQVKIGSTVISSSHFTSDSGTALVLQTPPDAVPGPVSVSVTTVGGTASAPTFHYKEPPSVASLSKTSIVHHTKVAITISGTNLTGATAVLLTKGATTVAGTNVVVVSGTSITFKTPFLAAGTYDVTVTTPAARSATSTSDHLSVT